MSNDPGKRLLFGVDFYSSTPTKLVEEICSANSVSHTGVRLFVTTNVDHVVRLRRDAKFYEAYSRAWKAVIDGFPVFVVARLCGLRIKHRIPGADIFPLILEHLSPKVHRPFFLASKKHSAEFIRMWLVDHGFLPDQIGMEVPPFGFENDPIYNAELTAQIRALGTTHLFLGIGCPKSELWVDDHRHDLGNLYAFCFGAGLEFFSGTTPRAPKIFRDLGFEWLFRLLRDPRRLGRRYLIDSFGFILASIDNYRFRGQLRHRDRKSSKD